MTVERFAPSPTGLLHLGHAFSALTAFENARATDGRFLLRVEDIDGPRCKSEFETALFTDLEWLGITWEEPVLYQSTRMEAYEASLEKLAELGLTYRCVCTRKDIITALSAPQEGDRSREGPDGLIYPRTCRRRPVDIDAPAAIRLDMHLAVEYLGDINALTYEDNAETRKFTADFLIHEVGDIVLARKDIGTSYHLAVVIDDAHQGITHVTRGEDMQPATPIHRVLQSLLNLPTPAYHHHRLIRDENNKRLAKRHDAMSLRHYRAHGKSPDDVRAMVGL